MDHHLAHSDLHPRQTWSARPRARQVQLPEGRPITSVRRTSWPRMDQATVDRSTRRHSRAVRTWLVAASRQERRCRETSLSAAASLPRRQAPSGVQNSCPKSPSHKSAYPQVLRLSSLWDIYSATLASADRSGTRTEHFTEREESTLLRPSRSDATCRDGRPHSGSRWFADTEEVRGSNPVALTTRL